MDGLWHNSDDGIRFTAVLRRSRADQKPVNVLEGSMARVYDALSGGEKSVPELEDELGLEGPNIRKILRSLRTRGLVEQRGGKGKPTKYLLNYQND